MQTEATIYGWNSETNPAPVKPWRDQIEMHWGKFTAIDDWLESTDLDAIRESFLSKGFAVIPDVIPPDLVSKYMSIHDMIESGEIHAPGRHDLGAHKDQTIKGKENVGEHISSSSSLTT